MSAKLRPVGSYSAPGHAMVVWYCLVDVHGVGHFGTREPVELARGLRKTNGVELACRSLDYN
jgi:hypothetical protein